MTDAEEKVYCVFVGFFFFECVCTSKFRLAYVGMSGLF